MERKRIIFFVLLLFCVSILNGTKLSLQDLPLIPGSVLKDSIYYGDEKLVVEYRLFLADGISFNEKMERARKEAQQVIEMMDDKGWILKKENLQRRGGEFLFKKDIVKEAKLTIAPDLTYQKGKGKNYIFYKFEMKRLIPFSDVPGYDYPDVPRFPESVRIRWMDLLGDYSVKYLVVSDINKVKAFFEKELPEFGWQPSKGSGTLNYQKGGYLSKDSKSLDKSDIEEPIKTTGKLIPVTLGVHLSENEGIVEIGIGRSAGAGGKKLKKPTIIPPELPEDGKKKVLTFIDYEKDLPIFPGLEKVYEENMPVNVSGQDIIRVQFETGLVEPKIAVEIAEFYLKKMKEKKWNLKEDKWYGLSRNFVFEKGAVKVKIDIKAIGRYPIPENAAKRKINIPLQMDVILPIPRKEIKGKDIEGVPRFPDSVRYYDLEAGLDHMVKYKAASALKEVEWFYIKKLPERGWTFAGYDQTGLLFVPEDTAGSASDALAKGKWIPTTLKVKVDDMWNGVVKIGLTKTRGD
ncbi:MAG: hypothetical protein ACOC6P_00005 [Candidatus Aminicenantaceae bacterium]